MRPRGWYDRDVRRGAAFVFVGVALGLAGCNVVFGLDPAVTGDDDGDGGDADGGPADAETVDAPVRRFDSIVNVAVGASPNGIATAKVGFTSAADVIVADAAGNTVSVVTCGTERVCQRHPFLVGNTPTSVAVLDANLDGRPDVAVPCYNANRVDLLLGAVDAAIFTVGMPIAYTQPYHVFAGRFSGDAKVDLLVTGASTMSIRAFTGNGAGLFTGAGTTTTTTPIRVITAGQLLDGETAEAVTSDDTIARMRQPDATGALFTYGNAIPGPADAFLAADLDGDLHGDLAVGYPGGGVTLYYGDGLGAYTSVSAEVAVPGGYLGLASGDLDGDGQDDDLAVATHDLAETARGVHLFYGDGARGFTPGAVLLPDGGPREVAIADVDGDGKNDVIMNITALNRVTIAFAD